MLMAFRQDLKSVVARTCHHSEDSPQEIERDVRMEEIAHRVDEDHPRPFPAQWLL